MLSLDNKAHTATRFPRFATVSDPDSLRACIETRTPAVWRGMGSDYPCCSKWGTTNSAFRLSADRDFVVFVNNSSSSFYLDGTMHPPALLTASMRMKMTLSQFFGDDGGGCCEGGGGEGGGGDGGGDDADDARPPQKRGRAEDTSRADTPEAHASLWRHRYLVEDKFSERDLLIEAAPPSSMPARGSCTFLAVFEPAAEGSSPGGGGGGRPSRSTADRDKTAETEPPAGATTGRFVTRQLFCSHGFTKTQMHRDCYDNLYLCCFGRSPPPPL